MYVHVGLGLCGTMWPAFRKWFVNQLAKIWTFMWRRAWGWHELALCEGSQPQYNHLQRICDELVTLFAWYRTCTCTCVYVYTCVCYVKYTCVYIQVDILCRNKLYRICMCVQCTCTCTCRSLIDLSSCIDTCINQVISDMIQYMQDWCICKWIHLYMETL